MRAGIATVQQTLTADAAMVLKRAISDAQRRGHAQVTPLHVASSLLACPSGMLQQACIQSHRHIPHPLHCRALELCFNVALERLPATIQQQQQQQSNSSLDLAAPTSTLSNALVAALKRAQAHQRRGCPEQQQVPLLAVKVEMEQLVISILDDPSVSRVMREAGFSSTRAKNCLEAVLNRPMEEPVRTSNGRLFSPGGPRSISDCPSSASAFCPSRDTDAVLATLCKRRKRNPVLLGEDAATGSVLKDLLARFESLQHDHQLKGAKIMVVEPGFGFSKDKTQRWLVEIAAAVEECPSLVVVLGSLAWCVEQSAMANVVMGDLGKILARAGSKVWLIATATSQCYMRFLAQYPAMENGLGFQPLPTSVSSIRPRFSLVEKHEQSFPRLPKLLFKLPEDNSDELRCCVDCAAKFEHESFVLLQEQGLSKTESVQSSSEEPLSYWTVKNGTNSKPLATTPQARVELQALTRELRKKWSRYCQLMHSSGCSSALPHLIDSNSSSSSPNGRVAQACFSARHCLASAKAAASASWLSLSTITEAEATKERSGGPGLSLGLGMSVDKPLSPGWKSKVTTELVLATPSPSENTTSLDTHHERLRDTSGCKKNTSLSTDAAPVSFLGPSPLRTSGTELDSGVLFKALYKGLCDKVPWQADAASKIASTVSQCKSGEKRNTKGALWLLFTGPDPMGKRKVAKVLAELLYGGDKGKMVSINLNQDRRGKSEKQDGFVSRGRTVMDRIADAVRMNPFSVLLLEEFDKAEACVRTTLIKCMERGRIQHSNGREVSFGNTAMVVTTSSSREKSGIEEKLEATDPQGIRVVFEEANSDKEETNRMKATKGGVSVVKFKQRGQGTTSETVLVACDEEEEEKKDGHSYVDKKRKRSRKWGERVADLIARGSSQKLDLNLGLRCTWSSLWDCDDASGLFDGVICFSELEVESIAEIVMERIEKLASKYGILVEVDLGAVETMIAFLWEEASGVLGFEGWIRETIEAAVDDRRCVAGDVGVVRIVVDGAKTRKFLEVEDEI